MCNRCTKSEVVDGRKYCQDCRDKQKKYRDENKELFSAMRKKYRDKQKKHRAENIESYREYQRNYQKNLRITTPEKRIEMRDRNFFNSVCRKLISGYISDNLREKMEKLVGCSVLELIDHLENRFFQEHNSEKIDWKNWSKFCENPIEVDHSEKLSVFNLLDTDERLHCWNYKNLRMVYRSENRPGREFNN